MKLTHKWNGAGHLIQQFGDAVYANDHILQTGTSSPTGNIYQAETSNLRQYCAIKGVELNLMR